jgi:ParB/RepB/Spo0J family partition protein
MIIDNKKVTEIPVERVFMQDRQREEYGDIDSLKFSIEQYGLLQPIVVEERPENKFLLIAGGRRLTAFKSLNRTLIPAIFVSQLDELSRKELEYEENIQRKNLTWIEECKAVNEIHRIKKLQFSNNFPERFGKGWSQKDTAQALQMSEGKVSQDCSIAEALEIHPEISKATNRKDALRMLRHLQENCVPDESLYQKKLRDSFVLGTPADCAQRLLTNSVDCFITDLTNLDYRKTLTLFADKLTFSGNGFIFFPFEDLPKITTILTELQLPHRKKPFMWHVKTDESYQVFLWFSRALAEPPKAMPDVVSFKRDKTNMHTLAKPYQVYYTIVVNTTTRNQLVVDPNAYDTTLARLCIDHGRNVNMYCSNKVIHEQGILNA